MAARNSQKSIRPCKRSPGVESSRLEIAGEVCRKLTRRGLSLAVAESCTGGLVGAAVTSVSGSSKCFVGGIVAYANRVKQSQLGVEKKLLESHGAVSAEVACAMARGVRERLDADVGIGVTGIAGPGGGCAKKPVGLVYIGISDKSRQAATEFRFRGSRDSIRKAAVGAALKMLRGYLK